MTVMQVLGVRAACGIRRKGCEEGWISGMRGMAFGIASLVVVVEIRGFAVVRLVLFEREL